MSKKKILSPCVSVCRIDESKILVIHYYVSNSEEFNNPANPYEGTTGNTLYTINEVYVHPEDIGQHM